MRVKENQRKEDKIRETYLKRKSFKKSLSFIPFFFFFQKPRELNCLSKVIKEAKLGPEAKSFDSKCISTVGFSPGVVDLCLWTWENCSP